MSRSVCVSCCALAAALVLAFDASTGFAQVGQAGFRKQLQHRPVYDYQPVSCDCGSGQGQGLGYWGPVDCGANCGSGCADGNCAGGSGSGDCGCGGCDGSCGCGPGNCNCGSGGGDSGSCGCSGGMSGDCASGGCGCGDGSCGDCGGSCGCGDCYGDCSMGCGSADEYCGDCGVPCECQPDCCLPRVTMFGDFLYLQSTDVDVAHAQQQDGLGGAGTVPFGEIGTIGTDFNPGFRVGGSVACGPCTQVLMSYTWYQSDAASSLDPPAGTNTGAVGSLVQHPGAALTASSGPVDANYEINFQLADLAWRRVFMHSPRYNLGFLCGVEYGHLEQDFTQNGVFGGGSGGAIDTSTAIRFDGGGIKVGVDGDHQFGHGLGIYGRLTGAALTGRFSSQYAMFNETTDQMLALASWKDDRVIGRFEYEVGASCTSMNEHWRVAAGYMFSYWANAVTTPDFIDAVQADNYTNVGNTLGFNGLVGRVEARW